MLTIATDNTITFKLQFTPPLFLANLAIRIALLYRKLRFGCAYRRILLTKGKYAIVDTEDFPKLSTHKWHLKTGRVLYAVRKDKTKPVFLHRQIINAPPDKLVDHINHNGLDNRKDNIRIATHAQNSQNSRINKIYTTSKFRGVCRRKDANKFRAAITCNNKTIQLGSFKNETDAAIAYDDAAIKYHKQFANLNFPPHYKRNILVEYFKKLSKIISATCSFLRLYSPTTPAPHELSANSRLIGAGNHETRAPNNDKMTRHFPMLFLQKILPSDKQIRILFDIIKETNCNFLTILYNYEYEHKRNNAFYSQPGSAWPPRPPPAPLSADDSLFTNLLFFFL